MAMPHAASGDIINIRPLAEQLKQTPSSTLVRAPHLEVFRLVLPAGKATQEHRAAGTITIQCLEGRLELDAHQQTRIMQTGDLVYLADAEPHAVRAIEDTALLITVLLHRE